MFPFKNIRRFLQKTIRQPWYALSVGGKRIRAYYAYNFLGGKSVYPEAITFFLTRMCNLRCKMCGQWGDSGAAKTHEQNTLSSRLSFEEIKKVLDEVSKFRPNITLFGGEPLVHPEAMDIMRYIKAKGLHCLIITNGIMLGEFARGIVDMGIDELNVSIDGEKELHDSIRGMPGAFDKITSGIDAVNMYKHQSLKGRPLVNIQCTINRYNYERLEEMLAVAGRLEADSLTFHNLIFLNQKAVEAQKKIDAVLNCSTRDWEGFVFEPGIEPRKLSQNLKAILRKKREFSIDYFPDFSEGALKDYYNNPDYLPSEYASRCLSPWVCGYIFPDGQVKPCLNSSYSFGNIKGDEFLKAWNSPKALEFRRLLKKNKTFPACARCTELYRY